MAHDGGGSPQCSLGTLKGSYVLAASGFVFTSTTTTVPKSLVEQVDFDGQGNGGTTGGSAVSLNGSPVLNPPSNGGVKYELRAPCVFLVTFSGGPTPMHYVFMAPDGDTGWTEQANANTSFQGTLTRVWPSKDRDDRR